MCFDFAPKYFVLSVVLPRADSIPISDGVFEQDAYLFHESTNY